eukprot:CAMPEP_0174336850 /NCGR_PEP_ID=MMETSP0810-20121108/21850_1 /TAXON_ID=73025 ORGANISM="Eutreptiella gymnastica-like, Strain CCMP1594" /NCGR_SAMPLE_ID=MMETSP0810 /ASSEMBLY_ACC=CAM_ASM_000659 /LENGTH=52 /DNA_ID=CAMNT_0015455951 /DNA_START=1087 /DNA_END=1242 /DNA_ORIENTATION=+
MAHNAVWGGPAGRSPAPFTQQNRPMTEPWQRGTAGRPIAAAPPAPRAAAPPP